MINPFWNKHQSHKKTCLKAASYLNEYMYTTINTAPPCVCRIITGWSLSLHCPWVRFLYSHIYPNAEKSTKEATNKHTYLNINSTISTKNIAKQSIAFIGLNLNNDRKSSSALAQHQYRPCVLCIVWEMIKKIVSKYNLCVYLKTDIT